MKKLTIMLAIMLTVAGLNAQTDTLYYLVENFLPETQSRWNSVPFDNTVKWIYQEGGNDSNPISAKSDSLNAMLYRAEFGDAVYRTLVSPPIDLSAAKKPQLSFWHTQARSIFNQDEMTLLFKNGIGSQWDTITSYSSSIETWTERVFNIEDIDVKYLAEDFYIGFLGKANQGNGICIDSVVIEEKGEVTKFVKSYSIQQVPHDIISSGNPQFPIVVMAIEVIGNTGTMDLQSISLNLNQGQDGYFESNSFKLYKTQEFDYRLKENGQNTSIGSPSSISGGTVSFTGLNLKLDIGVNYIWMTTELGQAIPHGSQISFDLGANAIQLSDTSFPAAFNQEIIKFNVSEAVFVDDFETTANWTLGGDFEIGAPQGLAVGSSKDPDFAYSASNVLGSDLSSDGMYSPNNTTSYYAKSKKISLKYYNDVKIHMKKWIDFSSLDRAKMEVSNDNESTWIPIWQSHIDAPEASSGWEGLYFDEIADQLLSRQDTVSFRFSIDSTKSPTEAGFNIDNFAIIGNHLDNDVGITKIFSPFDDCIGYYNDTIKITVRNYAEGPSDALIPVFFSLDGFEGARVYDTIVGPIAKDDSVMFVFDQLANFPQADIYDRFIVGIDLAGDEDPTNDTLTKALFISDNILPPNTNDFEYKGGLWQPEEGSTWLNKQPDGSIAVLPESPNSWILSPFGSYLNDDTTWVSSSCYDLPENRYILELKYWLLSESGVDGARMEYSLDDGETWVMIDSSIFGRSWGWYTDPVSSLGSIGWSGNTSGWTSAKELLPPAVGMEPKVKFRIVWASNGSINDRGLAFDDFSVYPAPHDVGVSAIIDPVDTCQFINPGTVKLRVKNYGYNTLYASDTIIVGVDFELDQPVIDTFLLASDLLPGDSVELTINTDLNIENAGTYNIKAYTLIEDDPWYYNANNDTASYSFDVWQNPLTGLVDTISSREPDTVVIRPIIDPGYTYLWSPGGSTADTLDVNIPGTYFVTVTDVGGRGCQTYDSVYVELLFYDVGIDSIRWPASNCELSNAEVVDVRIRNFGTDSLEAGQQIVALFELDGAPAVQDTITLTNSLLSGAAMWHAFPDDPVDVSGVGSYSIKSYTYQGGDTVTHNDTIISNIEVYGYPVVDLGKDTIVKALSIDLDAGIGFTSYLWNTDSTNQVYTVDTSGTYYVDVLDVNNCPASDTIEVWLKIRDLKISRLVSPDNSCDRVGTDQVQIEMVNVGTDTVRMAEPVNISYSLDQGAAVSEAISLNEDLLPGQSHIHQFAADVDLSAFKAFEFSMSADDVEDLRHENDTLVDTVYTSANPVVNLGEDQIDLNALSLELVAPVGDNYSYLWNGEFGESTYLATQTNNYIAIVTDTITGCTDGDTVFVDFNQHDYFVDTILLKDQICKGIYEGVWVNIKNNGNKRRESINLTLRYSVDGGEEYVESVAFTAWNAGTTQTHVINNEIDLNTAGSSVLNMSIEHPSDLRPENDLKTKTYDVLPGPDIDFGGDTLRKDLPYTLAPTQTFAGYEWSTGSTDPSILVTSEGSYSLTATDDNGCKATRSVFVEQASYLNRAAAEQLQFLAYPNPAQDILNIEVSLQSGDGFIVELYDIHNKLMMTEEFEGYGTYTTEFDVSALAKGIYFLRIRNKEIYQVNKIIVK